MNQTIVRTYTELSKFSTFRDRFLYLQIGGGVGIETFGFDRAFNQMFYTSREWRTVRDLVIARDLGCDLGLDGYEIFGRVLIHHMNPIDIDDIRNHTKFLLDPEYLITVSHETHNAIHYGEQKLLSLSLTEREPDDTCPWKKKKGVNLWRVF